MNLHITKSKNAESFYIAKSYVKSNGSTSSTIVRKLGTLNQLLVEHGPTRDDVLAWAKSSRNDGKIIVFCQFMISSIQSNGIPVTFRMIYRSGTVV